HDDLADHLVRHQIATFHVLLGLLPELSLLADRLPKYVPRRVVGQVEISHEPFGLRALPRPGRSHEDQIELSHERARLPAVSVRLGAAAAMSPSVRGSRSEVTGSPG